MRFERLEQAFTLTPVPKTALCIDVPGATETVRGDQRVRCGLSRRHLQSLLPIGAHGVVPVALWYANVGLVLRFPATLPMLRTGVAYAGYEEYAPTWGSVICALFGMSSCSLTDRAAVRRVGARRLLWECHTRGAFAFEPRKSVIDRLAKYGSVTTSSVLSAMRSGADYARKCLLIAPFQA